MKEKIITIPFKDIYKMGLANIDESAWYSLEYESFDGSWILHGKDLEEFRSAMIELDKMQSELEYEMWYGEIQTI